MMSTAEFLLLPPGQSSDTDDHDGSSTDARFVPHVPFAICFARKRNRKGRHGVAGKI